MMEIARDETGRNVGGGITYFLNVIVTFITFSYRPPTIINTSNRFL